MQELPVNERGHGSKMNWVKSRGSNHPVFSEKLYDSPDQTAGNENWTRVDSLAADADPDHIYYYDRLGDQDASSGHKFATFISHSNLSVLSGMSPKSVGWDWVMELTACASPVFHFLFNFYQCI